MIRTAIAPIALAGLAASMASADEVTLISGRDNTLFDLGSITSNGIGNTMHSGRTGFMGGATVQRAVMWFDIAAAIPAGSTINSASLTLWLEQGGGNDPQTHTLHRLQADWGEGTSNGFGGQGAPATNGDATWLHTFFPGSFWSTPGGDFDAAASGSQVVTNKQGFFTWNSTLGMVTDVQAWLDSPGGNYGWLLRGNETDLNTSRKFATREADSPEPRPTLVIDFDPPAPPCPEDLDDSGDVGFSDILAIIGAYGPCAPTCPEEDLDDSGDVGFSDILAVIGAWGPCP